MSTQFLDKARKLACDHFNGFYLAKVGPEDFYVVWFSKTLQNWKALVSTDVHSGVYYEITYNGNKQEAYVDLYRKTENVAVKDQS